jgi:hypothetical protein
LPIHPPLGNFNWYQSQTSHQNLITVRNDDVLTSKHVKENAKLKARLEVLTSKYVKMQKDHEMLKCSHENLQDAHVMLQVSHEVVVTSVKHFQPPTQKCTCSLNSINFICENACCSKSQQSSIEQIHVESSDDFIAKENDQLKLEGDMNLK